METILTITSAVGLTIGLTEVVKRTFSLESRYVPAVSLAIGVGIAYLFGLDTLEWITTGIMVGLSASGLYSGTKAVSGN